METRERKDYPKMFVWDDAENPPENAEKRIVLLKNSDGSCLAVDSEDEERFLNGKMFDAITWEYCKEIPKDYYITVADGFNGPGLLLRECWMLQSKNVWVHCNETVLFARRNQDDYPFKIMKPDGNVVSCKFVKFKKFSPNNPPSVNWPMSYNDHYVEGKKHTFHFSHYLANTPNCFRDGKTSLTGETMLINVSEDEYEFLNIEPVE